MADEIDTTFDFEEPEDLDYGDPEDDLDLAGFALGEEEVGATPLDRASFDLHLAEARTETGVPPGFRKGKGKTVCGNCVHYHGTTCELYDYNVATSDVCDSFQADLDI